VALNRLLVSLTYIKGWGTEVSHDEASDDHQFRSRRSAGRRRNSRHLATAAIEAPSERTCRHHFGQRIGR
jgi:hypothetical protein